MLSAILCLFTLYSKTTICHLPWKTKKRLRSGEQKGELMMTENVDKSVCVFFSFSLSLHYVGGGRPGTDMAHHGTRTWHTAIQT